MTYREKLLDPRWQRKRLDILKRDQFTCKHCGCTTKTLHVHHLFYLKFKDPWDYEDVYLITLCFKCHEAEEKAKEEVYKLLHDVSIACNSIKSALNVMNEAFFK